MSNITTLKFQTRILRHYSNYLKPLVSFNKLPIGKICFCSKASLPNVASKCMLFEGKPDRHKGIVIDSKMNFCHDINEFRAKLEVSLEKWSRDNLNGIWFNVAIPQVEWVPVLIEKGFKIHHASEDIIYLYYWLPESEDCKIPQYAHNMIGAGAAVINDKKQILVVSERYHSHHIWKLPGGYVNIGEDIGQAAMREVFEETGIKTEFVSLLGIRYVPKSAFGCSDMYFIVRLQPLSSNIVKQDNEIEDCQWMDLNEFLSHKDVYKLLRDFVKQALKNEEEGVIMDRTFSVHPITKTPQLIFSISRTVPSVSV